MENARFTELLDAFRDKRIAVVGDFILDEYLLGDTKRVSREAPVVVIDYRESRYNPGGAANAVQNVVALGAAARAFGIVGGDDHGRVLLDILRRTGADTSGLVVDGRTRTSVKTRILAGELHAQRQQVARLDRSVKVDPSSEALGTLGGVAEDIVEASDAVLISDYGLGVVPGPLSRDVVAECRKHGTPVVVDSRFNLLEFAGATVGTPNEVELFDAFGANHRKSDLEDLAARAVADYDFDGLIVTRGSKGMRVFVDDRPGETVGIVGSQDATDVTGAGDTVSATVALALAAGATLLEAAEVATYAAAHVVMRRGTATVTVDDLMHMRTEHPHPRIAGANS